MRLKQIIIYSSLSKAINKVLQIVYKETIETVWQNLTKIRHTSCLGLSGLISCLFGRLCCYIVWLIDFACCDWSIPGP